MSTILSLSNVSKTYARGRQRISVLENVDLDMARGEFVAIMGPSGSGKTTLLNIIGGLDSPSSGRVTVADKQIGRLSPRQLAHWRSRHIGFVFQFYNLLPVLTAAQNVELPLLLTGLSARRRRENVRVLLALVGLADRARHRPDELSGGQQQRVAIARALASDPSLLICDEPTGDLDRAASEDILGLLQVLNREHDKTIVMVTHDPKAAECAQRSLHVDKGRLTTGAGQARRPIAATGIAV